MKFLAKYGTNPQHATCCIKDYNLIFKSTIEQFHRGDFSKKPFQKNYLKGMKLPDKWERCYCTTDVFFNFVTWYLSSEIKNMTADDFFKLIKTYMTDANNEDSANVKNKESFKVDEWDIFKIGDTLFTDDPKNVLSIDKQLVNNATMSQNNDESNDSASGSSNEGDEEEEEEEEERQAITSLEQAVNVHDVTMLLLKNLISGHENQKLNRVLNEMESLQGYTEIDDGFKLDEFLEEFLKKE